jgi:uncharacterized protein YecE (DUF72 family)
MIRFGPAGWDYKDWSGTVYPKPAPRGFDPLVYLARYFGLVEVNATFYRPLPASVAESWCERLTSDPRFRLNVKLWRRFTHEREEAFGAAEVEQARAVPDALAKQGRLGAVLMQFPWSFRRSGESLTWIRDLARAFAGLPLVLEVRHASWNAPEVFVELAELGIGFVNVDQPTFKNSLEPSAIATAPIGYVRVHGRNFRDWFRAQATRDERYDYLYTTEELGPWAERVRSLAERPGTQDVYVVTNNHFRGQAAANAVMLTSMVERRRQEAPPELLARYRDALVPYVETPPTGTSGELF